MSLMKEILPHIYMGTIPAQTKGQNDVNIYMVHERGQTLIIDCGYDSCNSRRFFYQLFEEYPIRPEKTVLFLTHYHIDHTGMAWWFSQQGISIYIHEEEYEDARKGLERLRTDNCTICGLHQSEREILRGRVFCSRDYTPLFFQANTVTGGEILEIGSYRFQTVLLRGHTRAQTGLYDASAGILFSGDHILQNITPVILTTDIDQHYLATYYHGLDFVSSLKVHHLLPAHNAYLSGPAEVEQAIESSRSSYQHLCETVFLILEKSTRPMTSFQIVCRLYKQPRMELRKVLSLRHYLMAQKVLSCLEYLYGCGRVSRHPLPDGGIAYAPAVRCS